MEDLKKLLNEKQYQAVTSHAKYLRIIAGAGSGKTRVLTYRIVYLINELGYFPSTILAITFTNKAAEEIRNRIMTNVDIPNARLNVSTFHAFCARLLREECKVLDYPKSFTILDDDDQKKIVKDIIKDKEMDEKCYKISNMLDHISARKTKGISPEEDLKISENNEYGYGKAIIYQEYEKYLRLNYSMDFDDLILRTIEVFEKSPATLEKWQNRLQHILVDEFQDVDETQFKLLTLLAGEKNEVTVVGDPDQTIYTWRGADVNIILNFDKVFKGCETVALEQNYRSSKNILNVANRLIEHNHNRIKKELFTDADPGFEIATFTGENELAEARYVVDNINDMYDGKKIFYHDFAILYRNNAQSSALEQVLMERGIKYKIYGSIKFYKRAEIKDCISFLRLSQNFNDNIACERLIENTVEKVGKTTIDRIKAAAATDNVSIFEYLKNDFDSLKEEYKTLQGTRLQKFVTQIKELHDRFVLEPKKADEILNDHLHKYGYIDILIHLEMDDKIDNIKQFISQIKAFMQAENASLSDFIENVTLMSAQDEIEEDDAGDFVKLMTVHTAKGLEFDYVFIYGLVDSIFPNSRTIQESKDGIEEERRLFYVAITRARKRLFLSTSGGYSYMGARIPSRFLKEIKQKAVEERVTVRTDVTYKRGSAGVDNSAIRNGSIIKHDIFGEGVVINKHDDLIDVIFNDQKFGRKTLLANHKFVHLIK